jgi:hypothetical protein
MLSAGNVRADPLCDEMSGATHADRVTSEFRPCGLCMHGAGGVRARYRSITSVGIHALEFSAESRKGSLHTIATSRRRKRRRAQVECILLIGDVGLAEGKPALHVHGCVGHPDGRVTGGHLLQAVTWPTLEVFIDEIEVPLPKQKD